MKKIIMASVCGFASAAAAQSATLTIVAANPTFDPTVSTTITLSIFAEADFGTHIAGGEFALAGIDNASQALDMVGTAAAWGGLGEQDDGYGGNGNYNGLIFGQLIFPPFLPPAADSSFVVDPTLIGTVIVTMEASVGGTIGWDIIAGSGAFMLEVYDETDGSFTQLGGSDINLGQVIVSIPSAPSGMVLGLAGLAAVRRRR